MFDAIIDMLICADEGSDALDIAIAEAASGAPLGDLAWIAPPYSRSFDAAMQLVRPEDDIDSYEIFNDAGSWFIRFDTLVDGGCLISTRNGAANHEGPLEFCLQYFRHRAALDAHSGRLASSLARAREATRA